GSRDLAAGNLELRGAQAMRPGTVVARHERELEFEAGDLVALAALVEIEDAELGRKVVEVEAVEDEGLRRDLAAQRADALLLELEPPGDLGASAAFAGPRGRGQRRAALEPVAQERG